MKLLVDAIDTGSKDLSSIKRKTRLGMGRCQGRYCIPQAIKYLETRNIIIRKFIMNYFQHIILNIIIGYLNGQTIMEIHPVEI